MLYQRFRSVVTFVVCMQAVYMALILPNNELVTSIGMAEQA